MGGGICGLSFPLPSGLLVGLPRVRDNRTFWTRLAPSLGLLSPGDPSLLPGTQGYCPRVLCAVEEEGCYVFWRPRSLGSNPTVFIYKLCYLKQVT